MVKHEKLKDQNIYYSYCLISLVCDVLLYKQENGG